MAIVASFNNPYQQGIPLGQPTQNKVATFQGNPGLQGSTPPLQGSAPRLQGSGANLSGNITTQPVTRRLQSAAIPDLLAGSESTTTAANQAAAAQSIGYLDQSQELARQQQQAEAAMLEQNKAEVLRQYEQAGGLAQNRTALSIADIDAALSGTISTLEGQKNPVLEQTSKAQIDLSQGLSRQFGARGATDSTFYANAVARGQADLAKNSINELNKINMAISQAQSQAQSQKGQLQQMLSEKLLELEQTKSQFVYEQAKAIQNSIFNLDNYLLQIDQKKADVTNNLRRAAASGAGEDFGSRLQSSINKQLEQLDAESQYLTVPGGRDQLLSAYRTQYGDDDAALRRIEAAEAYARQFQEQQDPLAGISLQPQSR